MRHMIKCSGYIQWKKTCNVFLPWDVSYTRKEPATAFTTNDHRKVGKTKMGEDRICGISPSLQDCWYGFSSLSVWLTEGRCKTRFYYFPPKPGPHLPQSIRSSKDKPIRRDNGDWKRTPHGDQMDHGQETSIAILACGRADGPHWREMKYRRQRRRRRRQWQRWGIERRRRIKVFRLMK